MTELNPAEKAAVEALLKMAHDNFADGARAVVAAVRPHLFDEAAEHLIETCPHIAAAAAEVGNLQRAHKCCGHHMDAIKELRERGHKVPTARRAEEGQR